MSLTLQQLRELAQRHGFADPDTAAAIAMVESGGREDATDIVTQGQADVYNASHPEGPRHGQERSFGLWQINTLAHPSYDEAKLKTADYNAQAALQVSNGGTSWHPWSTYTSGAYKRFMPSEPSPAPATKPSPSADPFDTFVLAVLAGCLAYAATRKLRVPA